MFTTVAGVIASIATISTAVYGLTKYLIRYFKVTPQQAKEKIDREVVEEQAKTKETGRPQE